MELCVDYFDHYYSRYCLPVSYRCRIAAERQERRFGCGFWRPGEPDGIWSAWSGFGSFSGDHVVGNYFHADVDHAFDLCGAAQWADFGAFGSEAGANEIAAGVNDSVSGRAADCTAESGADSEIVLQWSDGRPRPSCSKLQFLSGEDARVSIGSSLHSFHFPDFSLHVFLLLRQPTKKGFSSLSSPMVVVGPCPGITTVSSGNVITRSCRERMIFA
jgi:hypothetical protein